MADTASDSVIGRRWRVGGASITGARHADDGKSCQDAHRWLILPGGILVVAVADGIGDAEFAETGAAVAVQGALIAASGALRSATPVTEEGWRQMLGRVVHQAREAVVRQAEEQGYSSDAMATTLIVGIATALVTAVAQIGDGAVVVMEPDGTVIALTAPPRFEYVNETLSLTSADDASQAQFVIRGGPVTGLAFFTDGFQRIALKWPERTPQAAFFRGLFRFLEGNRDGCQVEDEVRRFLLSPRLRERTDDDVTLVLAIPQPNESQPTE